MSASAAAQRGRPTGRRPGDSGTRDAILDAALTLFADKGYDGGSLRAIASRAEVDPSLIRHFFGDKEGLFAAVLADRTAIFTRLADVLAGDRSAIGRRAADVYLSLWEDPETSGMLLALVRSVTSSPRATEILQGLLGSRLVASDLSSAEVRGRLLAGTHLLGIAFARHVVGLPVLTAMSHDDIVDMVAPTIQGYLAPDAPPTT